MSTRFYVLFSCFFGMSILACTNEMSEIDELTNQKAETPEVTTDVELLYSDSAQVKVRIISPSLIRQSQNHELQEEFPNGIHVEFLSENGAVSSYLDADYATRKERKGIIVAENNVVVYNKNNEKLETSQLTWNEFDQTLQTSRFVRITRPAKGDTIHGYGLTTDQEFTRFEILEVLGRSKFEKIVKDLR